MKEESGLKRLWGGVAAVVLGVLDALVVMPFHEIQRADSLSDGVFLAFLALVVDVGLLVIGAAILAWAVYCPEVLLACMLPPAALVGLVWLAQRSYRRRMERKGNNQ